MADTKLKREPVDGWDWSMRIGHLYDLAFEESEGPDAHRVDFSDGTSLWLRHGRAVEGQVSQSRMRALKKLHAEMGLEDQVEYKLF